MRRIAREKWFLIGLSLIAVSVVAAGAFLSRDRGASNNQPDHGRLESYSFVANFTSGELIKGWYQRPGKTRWELGPEGPEEGRTIFIFRDDELTHYDGEVRVLTTEEVPPDPEGDPQALPSSLLIGPLPVPLDQLTASLPSSPSVRDLGFETIAGRRARVIEIPFRDDAPTTLWLDEEFDFVLKQVTPTPEGTIEAAVTQVSFNVEIPGDVFSFSAPSNLTDLNELPVDDDLGLGTGFDAPQPYLDPTYAPPGFVQMGNGTTVRSDKRITAVRWTFRNESGTEFDVEEAFRPGGLTPEEMSGSLLVTSVGPAYESVADTELHVVVDIDDLVVTITGDVSREEMVRIIEGLH